MTPLLTSESSQFQPHGLSQERATMKKPKLGPRPLGQGRQDWETGLWPVELVS